MKHILWREVERLLAHHQKRGDITPLMAANRLFGEQCKRAGVTEIPTINQQGCCIQKEQWTPDQLRRLVVWHGGWSPTAEEEPVLAIHYNKDFYVIDGSNRINKWRLQVDGEDREVIIITPK